MFEAGEVIVMSDKEKDMQDDDFIVEMEDEQAFVFLLSVSGRLYWAYKQLGQTVARYVAAGKAVYRVVERP